MSDESATCKTYTRVLNSSLTDLSCHTNTKANTLLLCDMYVTQDRVIKYIQTHTNEKTETVNDNKNENHRLSPILFK